MVVASSLGSAQPPQTQAQNEAAGSAQKAASTVADAIRKAGPSKDYGCQDRKDKRASDLCAQWSAVDAARNAALATWIAVILSFIGTAFVAVTLILTVRTSRRELRAYVSVKPLGLPVFDVGEKPCATVTITNGGATPAYEVEQYGTVLIDEFPLKLDPLAGEMERLGVKGQSTLHRGDEHSAPIQAHGTVTPRDIDDIVSGRKVIYVIGNVDYLDTFRKKRRTEFCYFLDGEALRNAGRSAQEGDARGENKVTIKWTLGNLHTKAT
jgi:hypothetical protein